jgi:radical SAM superfamily enzyme YgiQ (UPF0313 family)
METEGKLIDCILAYPAPATENPVRGTALSIFYPGAMLEQHGFEVEYFDERFDAFEALLTFLQAGVLAVGVSAMTGHQLLGAKKILTAVKKINPEIYTILGGPHPTILPKECLKEDLVDFVVAGEGEKTLLELITVLKSGGDLGLVDGLYWKKEGKVMANRPRAFMEPREWPFPMTEKNKKYFKISAARGELMFQASRGCPFDCNFCYNQIMNRRTWRQMPLDKFERELKIFLQEFSFNHLYVNDDNFGSNKERIRQLVKILHNHGLSWSTGFRCSDMDDEVAQLLDQNGCEELLLGVESGSDWVLHQVINKKYPKGVEDIKNCARALSRTAVRGRYNFIAGLPGETMAEVFESMALVDWIYKTDKNAIFCFDAYSPYPGTKLYQEAVKQGFKQPTSLEEWSRMSLDNASNPIAQNLYYLSGLRFRGKQGDVTSKNFPGLKRLIILPFEISARLRWKFRFLKYYALEKAIIKKLFVWAANRAAAR